MSGMRTTAILETSFKAINGEKALIVEEGFYNKSNPFLLTGNVTETLIPAPA